MTVNPLRELHRQGQSPWLDQIRREWLKDGQLAQWIEEDGIRGVTSNPSIFKQAIVGSDAYVEQMRRLAAEGADATAIYDALTIDDIRAACDVFMSVFEATGGTDGFVSHEVSPSLAYDTWGTIHEARRLWGAIDRPNLMIKIPATREGLPAIEHCLSEGINVNVTLMFSMAHYEAVTDAYLRGLEARRDDGASIAEVSSVASMFVSRVDTFVDDLLEKRMKVEGDPAELQKMRGLLGKAAVANAKRIYRRFQQVFTSKRFTALESNGAHPQRVLWASTSTKNPDYSDVKYVEELIGPRTVNTLPLNTMLAFRDHGVVAATLGADLELADAVVEDLALLGIDLDDVGDTLQERGVDSFAAALDDVLEAVEARIEEVR
jgi:transaldolase